MPPAGARLLLATQATNGIGSFHRGGLRVTPGSPPITWRLATEPSRWHHRDRLWLSASHAGPVRAVIPPSVPVLSPRRHVARRFVPSDSGTYSVQSKAAAGGERLILMPPDVAGPVGAQEFSKQAARAFIHAHARGSLGKMIQYMPLEGEARVSDDRKWLQNLTEEQRLQLTVPLLESPERCYIVVVGADRAKTAVFASGPAPVTVGIDQYMR